MTKTQLKDFFYYTRNFFAVHEALLDQGPWRVRESVVKETGTHSLIIESPKDFIQLTWNKRKKRLSLKSISASPAK